MYKALQTLQASLFLFVLSFAAQASNISVDANGVALHGYDPVSYFSEERQKGSPSYSFTVDEATYYFINEENREKFSQAPKKYQPQFGGYCSYGVRLGQKFKGDPAEYVIHDDKLYLLYNRGSKQRWEQERDRNIAIAERLWPQLIVRGSVSGHADF